MSDGKNATMNAAITFEVLVLAAGAYHHYIGVDVYYVAAVVVFGLTFIVELLARTS